MSKARELAELSRTVSDSADAVAITIDSSENVTFANDITVTGALTLGSTAITATGTELNYVDGVTSAIQTQLDAISGSAGITGIVDNSDATAITIGSDEKVTFTDDIIVANNKSAIFGTSTAHLDITTAGTNSFLKHTGGGALVLATNTFQLRNAADSATSLSASATGAVSLRYNGSEKLQTAGTGVVVTGIMDATDYRIGNATGFENQVMLRSATTTTNSQGSPITTLGPTVWGDLHEMFHTNGSKKLETTSSGIKITGTLDTYNLVISGSQGSDGQVLTSTGSGIAWEDAASGGGGGTAGIVSSANATAMTINSDEEIGIGVTNQGDYNANARNLVIGGSGSNGITLLMDSSSDKARIDFRGASTTGSFGNLYPYIECTSQFASNPYDQMIFAVSGSEFMRFGKGSGSIGTYMLFGKSSYLTSQNGVQTSKGYEWVWTSPSVGFPISVHDGNGYKFEVRGNGRIYSSSTSVSAISDERVKEKIVDLETGLTQIMALKPRRFDWREGEGTGEKNVAGFIAQEVESVLPDLIDFSRHDTIADCKALKMGDMIPTMVKAMQEQQAVIESLTNRIAALEQ